MFSRFNCRFSIHCRDANELAAELPEMDVVYLDPPYNQHPYGSNYFMLNLLSSYEKPAETSRVSGIPRGLETLHVQQPASMPRRPCSGCWRTAPGQVHSPFIQFGGLHQL